MWEFFSPRRFQILWESNESARENRNRSGDPSRRAVHQEHARAGERDRSVADGDTPEQIIDAWPQLTGDDIKGAMKFAAEAWEQL